MVRWTAIMLQDLQNCRVKALELRNGDNPPLKADGKKKNYLDILQQLWSQKGYEHLNISRDNMGVRVNKLKLQTLTDAKLVRKEILKQQSSAINFGENIQEEENANSAIHIEAESNGMCNQWENTLMIETEELSGDTEANFLSLNAKEVQPYEEIMETANTIVSTIIESPGNFENRT